MPREVGPVDLGDGSAAQPAPDDAVVVEHGVAVGGEPHVALEARGAQAHGQAEGVEGVLRCVSAGPAVGEADRRTQGGEAAHATSMPSGARPPAQALPGPTGNDHPE